MNQFMTRRAKPNNLEMIFIEIARMMTMNAIVLLSAIFASIWLYNLAFLDGVHQSGSGFISIGMFCLGIVVVFLDCQFALFCFTVFLSILTIDGFSLFRLPILFRVFFAFIRALIPQSSFNTRRRQLKFLYTCLANSKMTILAIFVTEKLFKRFGNTTSFTRFHSYLSNKKSPLARRGLVSMQPRPKGELEYDFITKRLHRQNHYNTLEVSCG